MTAGNGPALRADAERNRRLILHTADQMLAERRTPLTLNDVAKAAGLGVGTVYRRFPDVESLTDALFTERFTLYLKFAAEASAEADAGRALVRYLLTAAASRAGDPGLETILAQARLERPELRALRDELGHRVDALVSRALEAEAVNTDFSSADVYSMLYMLGAVADRTEQIAPGAWRRYAGILLTGFGLRSDSAQPATPMSDTDLLKAWPTSP